MRTTWQSFSNKTKPLTFLLALTFLFLFCGSVFGQEEVKKEYHDNGKLKSEVPLKNGIPEGTWTYYYNSGEKYYEITYKNGIKEGLVTGWYRSGKKMYEYHNKNGVEEGLEHWWYESGEKKAIKHFKNGEEHGIRKEWDKEGKKIYEGKFIEGIEISTDQSAINTSFEEYVTAVFKSFDPSKLEKLGFYPEEIKAGSEVQKKKINGYSISIKEPSKKIGTMFLFGSENMNIPSTKKFLAKIPRSIMLWFGEMPNKNGWKLLTFEGHVENYRKSEGTMLSPELQAYFKSKFESMEFGDFVLTIKN
jgi:hypothetical protein